ncbi:MAG: hypothetical protein RIC87_14835 [Kiloniellales bacterium]
MPSFYKAVGASVKAWQAPPPKVRRGRDEADDVTPEALSEEAAEKPDRREVADEDPQPFAGAQRPSE